MLCQRKASHIMSRQAKRSSAFWTTGQQLKPRFVLGPIRKKGQIAGALHVLKKRGKVVLISYGKYAKPGTAAPHIYAKDAIDEALKSGSKTVRDLQTLTGKNRGELWAALQRKKAKGQVIEAYLIHVGRRGRQAAFAMPR
jgi:hypothetical protein